MPGLGGAVDETLTELSAVAKQYILSYRYRGKSPPAKVSLSLTGLGK